MTGHIRKGRKMVEKHNGRIVETATEARQAEPGPSIFLVLVVSVVLAVTILGVVWFIFFKI
jgi:cobalamin biosynthesis Mg chelatase CobN